MACVWRVAKEGRRGMKTRSEGGEEQQKQKKKGQGIDRLFYPVTRMLCAMPCTPCTATTHIFGLDGWTHSDRGNARWSLSVGQLQACPTPPTCASAASQISIPGSEAHSPLRFLPSFSFPPPLMLLHYATRVARVRQLLLTPTLPLPRRPFFFSTTAHHFRSLQEDRSKFSGSLITPTEDTQSESDSESTLTNQTVTPVSVSFTVSPPPTFAFLKPTPVVLLTAPFGGNWYVTIQWAQQQHRRLRQTSASF